MAHLGLESLTPNAVVDSMIAEPATVAEAITRLCSNYGIKTRTVAGAVCGHSVIMKKISLVAAGRSRTGGSDRAGGRPAYSVRPEGREPGLPGAVAGGGRLDTWRCCWWP